ncbi:MAG: trehalose-phosphatase [Calothrix sp. SM1_5_4]|nr:trehalose-phosphatase [Calothrix sp. SM1_5_4]
MSRQPLLAFDFDGTLAPITPRPEETFLTGENARSMKQLARDATVAVISGRSRSDLLNRMGFEPRYVIGNHGMEGVPGWRRNARTARKLCREWLSQLGDPCAAGVFFEDKIYSLSLHYRLADRRSMARERMLKKIKVLSPAPRVIPGKFVLNLMPFEAPDKGKALREIMNKSGRSAALFVGDDVTDEDVFRLSDRGILSVRVGRSSRSRARFYLRNQEQVKDLLRFLLVRQKASIHG